MPTPEKIVALSPKQQFLAEHLRDGEDYAGIILGKDGAPDYHLIQLPGEAENVTFQQAQAFAKKAGGELPTRREQSLLFANLKEKFQSRPRWYWSGEKHASASGYAWIQYFDNGSQNCSYASSRGRARAVRRLPI